MAHIEEAKLDYTIDDFSFRYKTSPGAKIRTPKQTPPAAKKAKPMKRPLLEKTEQAKSKRKKTKVPKSRAPAAARGPRRVLQPDDSKKDKASRSQAFQKLLVKMNFLKPGERQMTSSESESEDDFDGGMV